MTRRHSLILMACLALAAAGCGPTRHPPAELAGLWSAGPAACAAGVGVVFGTDAISAVYDRQQETLFDHPRYQIESVGAQFRIRIVYELPHRPGGARMAGAHGVLVLARGENGRIDPRSHMLRDGRTGSARLRLVDDPALAAMELEPCGRHPWREELRGRRA